jgi:hypothetical protein
LNVIKKEIWVLVFSFMYLVLVDAMDWSELAKHKRIKNKKNGIQITNNYWVDFSILDHCGSQAYTCGNIDLSQSSAITVKRCWHIHHPLSKRLIQSPERLGIGWSDVISPLLYAAMVTLLAKPGGCIHKQRLINSSFS